MDKMLVVWRRLLPGEKNSKATHYYEVKPQCNRYYRDGQGSESGGADAVSLINTLTGMKIDIHKRAFLLANKTGGLSPAIKPIALRMVYQVANSIQLPIIGMGGILTAEDALEFIMAGATMVAIGTKEFH